MHWLERFPLRYRMIAGGLLYAVVGWIIAAVYGPWGFAGLILFGMGSSVFVLAAWGGARVVRRRGPYWLSVLVLFAASLVLSNALFPVAVAFGGDEAARSTSIATLAAAGCGALLLSVVYAVRASWRSPTASRANGATLGIVIALSWLIAIGASNDRNIPLMLLWFVVAPATTGVLGWLKGRSPYAWAGFGFALPPIAMIAVTTMRSPSDESSACSTCGSVTRTVANHCEVCGTPRQRVMPPLEGPSSSHGW